MCQNFAVRPACCIIFIFVHLEGCSTVWHEYLDASDSWKWAGDQWKRSAKETVGKGQEINGYWIRSAIGTCENITYFEKVKFSIGPFFSKRRVSFCCYRFNLVCYQLRDLVATFILALIVGFNRRWCIGCHLWPRGGCCSVVPCLAVGATDWEALPLHSY